MVKKSFKEARIENPVEGVKLYWLVDKEDGAENFSMRLFEIEPGAHTEFHSHPWEHEVFIVEGEGVIRMEEGKIPFSKGDAILVRPNEKHQFLNRGKEVLKLICVIPL